MLAGRHGLTTLCRPRHRDFLQWTERLLHAEWAVNFGVSRSFALSLTSV